MVQVSSFGLVRRHHVLLFALWAFLFQSVAQSQTCYRPSQIFVGSPWTPCNASAEVSYCCSTDDVCLANGYCYGVYLGFLYRPSCTDRTWKDPSCPYYCADCELIRFKLQISQNPNPCANRKQWKQISILVLLSKHMQISGAVEFTIAQRAYAITQRKVLRSLFSWPTA